MENRAIFLVSLQNGRTSSYYVCGRPDGCTEAKLCTGWKRKKTAKYDNFYMLSHLHEIEFISRGNFELLRSAAKQAGAPKFKTDFMAGTAAPEKRQT